MELIKTKTKNEFNKYFKEQKTKYTGRNGSRKSSQQEIK